MAFDLNNDRREPQIEQPKGADTSRDTLSQEAIQLFECRGGALVRHPFECPPRTDPFGRLLIDGIEEPHAGRTIRRGQGGWTTDGGKVELT